MTRSFFSRFAGRKWMPLLMFLILAAFVCFTSGAVQAQTPPANAVIGNQATATYTDGSNVPRSATSNTVQTTVQQVAAIDLTADNTKVAAPGSPIYFPHTVTNNGNGSDNISLAAANAGGDNFDVDGNPNVAGTQAPVIYADADGNGVPDNNTPITSTGPLAPGSSFKFVVAGVVPATALSGQNATVNVTATSGFDGAITDANTDTVTISTNAVVNVVKSIDVGQGASPSGPRTYTLTYTNTGNATATNLTITDVIPAGMTYVAGSGRWSVSGATALTDAAGGDPAGIAYDFNVTAANRVTAVVASVAPGVTGRVTFQVNVNAGVAPGQIPNTAPFNYDDDGNGATPPATGTSNTVIFTVVQTAGVTFNGDTVASVPQGGVVTFNNVLTNTGNGTDTFDITLNTGASTFPAGSSYKLFQSDGVTPLLDSTGNGIPDTGPVAAGGTYTVVLQVTLPGPATGGPFSIDKLATSRVDPNVSDPATDTLTAITASSVDIQNAAAAGAGAGPEVAPVTTVSGNPGATVTIPVVVVNTGPIPDSYDLQTSATAAFTPPVALPAGWSVRFRNASGAVVTNTGVLAPGASANLTAEITIPANSSPGDQEVFFRSVSPTTGAADIIHDRVTVNAVNGISLEPNNTGQVFQGSAITYQHTLTNTGNTALNNVAISGTNTAPGFTSVIYQDTNNNGILDPAEAATPLTNVPVLAPGASIPIFVRVFAPSGAADGTVNVTTVTATDGTNSDTATDTTTVVAGDLKVDKFQSVNGGAFTQANQSALPGSIVRYRIVVTNTGGAAVTNVVVNDATPAFTVYDDGDATASITGVAGFSINGGAFTAATGANGTTPVDGSAGSLRFNVGTLQPGESAVITFGVRING
jgi:trimeric autotransporter adhesin